MKSDVIIHGKEKNLGGFSVYRILPDIHKRSIGPFVFIDHLGPMTIDDTHALDVRPHPHIGLSTVTYLFQGKVLHQDNLGNRQIIEPGDLNWMTAGSGIVHSERTPPDERAADGTHHIHGIQIWVALPKDQEDCEPHFIHYDKELFPETSVAAGLRTKILIGKHGAATSPVRVPSPTFFAIARAEDAVNAHVTIAEEEIGIFVVMGEATVDGQKLKREDLLVPADPRKISLQAPKGTILAFFGGQPFPEKRVMWWNFVSSSGEKIRAAAERWKNQEMKKVPGETEFIPLPNDPLPR